LGLGSHGKCVATILVVQFIMLGKLEACPTVSGLHIEVAYVEGVFLDELAPRRDFIPH